MDSGKFAYDLNDANLAGENSLPGFTLYPAKHIPQEVGFIAVLILMNACGAVRNPRLQQAIRDRWGFDATTHLDISVPYTTYLEVAEFLRTSVFPQLSYEAGYEEIGYRIAQAYFQTEVGKVIKSMAGIMGPERNASQFLLVMSKSLPWGKHELLEVRPNFLTYRKSLLDTPPTSMVGMLKAALEASGATVTRANYVVTDRERDEVTYHVEWK